MKKIVDEKLNKEISSYKKMAIPFSFLDSLNSLLLVFFALASKQVINLAIDQKPLTLWIILLICSGALIPTVRGLTTYITSRYSDKKAMKIRCYIFDTLLRKDALSVGEMKNGELLNRLMTDSSMCVTFYTMFIPTFVGQIIQLVASFVFILFIKPIIGCGILVLGLSALVIMIFVRKALKKQEKKVMKAFDEVTSFVSEGVGNIETLKIVADNKEVERRINDKQLVYLKHRNRHRKIYISFSSLFSLAVQAISVGLVIYGAIKIAGGAMTYGDLTALIELIALFKSPISALTGVQSALASYGASRDRINMLLSIKDDNEEAKIEGDIKEIIFDKVSFSYKNEDIISSLSFKLNMSSISRFDGESGAGKSTLFKIILGIYNPTGGKILIKTNKEEFDVTNKSLLSLFSYVPQSCLVFAGSIFDNLKLSNPDISEEEALSALKDVNLSSFDLDYMIKENNEGLSRGEAQRLCIARAILSKRPFLILDEATSSLDDSNAQSILKILAKKYKCILYSSHKEEILDTDEVKHIKL